MLRYKLSILPIGDAADMAQLLWVANDDSGLCAVEERQRRGDIALAGLVDHDQIEEPRLKGDAGPCRERGDGPAAQRIRHFWEDPVVLPEYLLVDARLLLVNGFRPYYADLAKAVTGGFVTTLVISPLA